MELITPIKHKISKSDIIFPKETNNTDDTEQLLKHYFKKIEPHIKNIIFKESKKFEYESTIFGIQNSYYISCLKIAYSVRQLQMKEGLIAQTCMGCFYGWEDLKVGHKSGLDLRKTDGSCVIELKNKYNTCNSASQKTMLDKLANYKKNNPNCMCVWGILNPKNKTSNLKEKLTHNGEEIYKIQGTELLKLIFTHNGSDLSHMVIEHIQNKIQTYVNLSQNM